MYIRKVPKPSIKETYNIFLLRTSFALSNDAFCADLMRSLYIIVLTTSWLVSIHRIPVTFAFPSTLEVVRRLGSWMLDHVRIRKVQEYLTRVDLGHGFLEAISSSRFSQLASLETGLNLPPLEVIAQCSTSTKSLPGT